MSAVRRRDAYAPEAYAGDALLTLAAGGEPDPPLTPFQIARLVRMGFIVLRDDAPVLTRKGECLVEDIAAECQWLEARGAAL